MSWHKDVLRKERVDHLEDVLMPIIAASRLDVGTSNQLADNLYEAIAGVVRDLISEERKDIEDWVNKSGMYDSDY